VFVHVVSTVLSFSTVQPGARAACTCRTLLLLKSPSHSQYVQARSSGGIPNPAHCSAALYSLLVEDHLPWPTVGVDATGPTENGLSERLPLAAAWSRAARRSAVLLCVRGTLHIPSSSLLLPPIPQRSRPPSLLSLSQPAARAALITLMS
jgi:hypothetical protein